MLHFTLPNVFYRLGPVVHPCFLVGFKRLAGAIAFLRVHVTLGGVHRGRGVGRFLPAPGSRQRAVPLLLHVHPSGSYQAHRRVMSRLLITWKKKGDGEEEEEEETLHECKLFSHLRNQFPKVTRSSFPPPRKLEKLG